MTLKKFYTKFNADRYSKKCYSKFNADMYSKTQVGIYEDYIVALFANAETVIKIMIKFISVSEP
jgi:hypothetical protein